MIVDISQKHVAEHAAAYVEISSDVSPWTAENFLRDAPSKWDLSFSIWDGGKPIAYCILSERRGAIHINQLMVAPGARGHGVGAAALAEAVRRGAISLKVDPSNTKARAFYARHGWREAGAENGYCVYSHSYNSSSAIHSERAEECVSSIHA